MHLKGQIQTRAVLLIAQAAVLLLAGCGSAGLSGKQPSSPTPGDAVAGGSQGEACARVPMYGDKLFKKGNAGDLPSNFVSPPSGAAMCGTIPETDTILFVSPFQDREVITYYYNSLKAQGYEVTSIREGCAPGHQTFEFKKPGVAAGQVYTVPEEGYYSVVYQAQGK